MKPKSDVPEITRGRAPLAEPFVVKEGQCLLRMAQERLEEKASAVERAKEKTWWPRIIDPTPRLFRGYWTWLGKEPT